MDETQDWLRARVARSLNVPPDQVDVYADLSALGLDSVEAVGLVGELERRCGRTLSDDLCFEHRSIAAIAAHLSHVGPRLVQEIQELPTTSTYARTMNPQVGLRLEALDLDKAFVRGEGSWLTDADGHRYLDGIAAYGALPLGHNPAEIWEALTALRDAGEPNFVQPSCLVAASELAERLLACAPRGLVHVTFANSGAECAEVAIKLCRAATGRHALLTTRNSFHGKTTGALAATGNLEYQRGFLAPGEAFQQIPYGDLAALEEALTARASELAGFIVEPIQGEGGIVVPPAGYLRAAQELCRRHGVLFVVDEIQTGLGRTGALFACTDEGLEPDVLLLAKALGGGLMPVGACLVSRAAWSERFALKHSSTFAGNALAARAGLAMLDVLQRDDGALVRAVREHGERLRARLLELRARYPRLLLDVRGRGYMLGLELTTTSACWPDSLLGVAAEQRLLAPLFASYLLNVEGLRLAPTLNGSNVLRIEPPLNMSWACCETLLGAIERAARVFSRGDAATVLRSILERRELPSRGDARAPSQRRRATAREGDARFAFVLHPMDAAGLANVDPDFIGADERTLARASEIGGMLDPFVLSTTRVVSPTGRAAAGEFIALPYTAAQLAELPAAAARRVVGAAVDLATQRGATLVGLGAYSSVVTAGGLSVQRPGLGLTSGNAYTVVASHEALVSAMELLDLQWGDATTAILGATGAIGGAMAALAATRTRRLVLLGNPRRRAEDVYPRLLDAAAGACRHVLREAREVRVFPEGSLACAIASRHDAPAPDAPDATLRAFTEDVIARSGQLILSQAADFLLPMADVVVTATSSTDVTVTPSRLRHGAVICDLSVPPNVGRETSEDRPDVLVLDGGIIQVPGAPFVAPIGLGPGLCYACMAETMMLALDGHVDEGHIGPRIPLAAVQRMQALADTHGFRVATLRSFGRALDPERLRQVVELRRLAPPRVA